MMLRDQHWSVSSSPSTAPVTMGTSDLPGWRAQPFHVKWRPDHTFILDISSRRCSHRCPPPLALAPPPSHFTCYPVPPHPPPSRLLLFPEGGAAPSSPSSTPPSGDLPSALPGRTLSLWMAPSMMCPAVIEHYEVFHASLH